MANINCSLDCVYQKDGKCTYNTVTDSDVFSFSKCAYFISKNN